MPQKTQQTTNILINTEILQDPDKLANENWMSKFVLDSKWNRTHFVQFSGFQTFLWIMKIANYYEDFFFRTLESFPSSFLRLWILWTLGIIFGGRVEFSSFLLILSFAYWVGISRNRVVLPMILTKLKLRAEKFWGWQIS